MVPASLRRSAVAARPREATLEFGGRGWRPQNVPFSVRAELSTLMTWGAMIGALGVVLLLGYVWVRLKVVEAGYRLSATRQLVERLEQEGRELVVRAAAADSAENLAKLAEARLGMHHPGRDQEAALP